MFSHMKETGAKILQQAEGRTFCGPNSTLAPIEFLDVAPQSSSPSELPESELYTRSNPDTS